MLLKTDNGVAVVFFSALLLAAAGAEPARADNFVRNISKAPIVSDGDVAGRQADFVIDLDVSLDPADPGIALAAGDEIRVALPGGFTFDAAALAQFPFCSIGGPCPSTLVADACVPGTLACTTGVFLRGYPQSPLFPDISRDGDTVVFAARADTGPVVKQVHLIGKGIFNPGPGGYRIGVTHVGSDGTVIDAGSGRLKVLPSIRPSINITSVFASLVGGGPPFANTIYQTVVSGPTEFPWNFLVWDTGGVPFTDIELQQVAEDHYLLRRGNQTVGHASVDGPDDGDGVTLDLNLSATLPGTPVIGRSLGGGPPPPVQRLQVQFDAGPAPEPGRYTTTIRLNRGNEVELFVDVPGEDDDDDDGDDDD